MRVRSLPTRCLAGAVAFRRLRPTRQETGFTCGPAALQCVLGFTRRRANELALAEALGTTERHGTTPAQLLAGARALRLRPTLRRRMSLRRLLGELERGHPVIVLWNDHGGHWAVAVGVHVAWRALVLADPAARRGLKMFDLATFRRHWHATVAGRRHRQLGIVCRPA